MTSKGALKLPASSRLKSRSEILELFSCGKSTHSGMLRGTYSRCCAKSEDSKEIECGKMMVSVPKKNFRRAVQRNFLKRRVREAFRLVRGDYDMRGVRVAFIYSTTKVHTYAEIEASMRKILDKISKCCGEH